MKDAFMRRLFSSLAIVLSFLDAYAFCEGTREEIVTSIHGGSPYLLVFHSASVNSTLEPGLYIRTAEGEWRRTFKGNVLPAPIRGGLQLQFAMGNSTGRFEGIALIDGRLVLFGTQSNEANPGSFLVLGSSSNPLIDPITGNHLELPLIENASEVSIASNSLVLDSDDREVVVVSIKHRSPLGSGMTFAFSLSPKQNSGSNIVLNFDPILLDWKYWPQSEVSSRLILKDGHYGFDSLNLTQKMARAKTDDPARLKKWRSRLRDEQIFSNSDEYPYLRLLDGKIEINECPSEMVVLSASHNGKMVYDPIENRHGFYFQPARLSFQSFLNERPAIQGQMVVDSSGEFSVSSQEWQSGRSNALVLLRFKDQWPVFAVVGGENPADSNSRLEIKPVDHAFAGETPIDLSWSTVLNTNIVLVSWKFASGSQTAAYDLDLVEHSLQRTAQNILSKRYFSSSELGRRINIYDNTVVFDDSTPDCATSSEYNDLHKLTAPHIDLVKSLEPLAAVRREVRVYYPQAIEKYVLSDQLDFRRFETSPGMESRTGIYIPEKKTRPAELFIRGDIVKLQASTLPAGRLAELDITTSQLKGNIFALAIDNGQRKRGKPVVELMLIYSPHHLEGEPQVSKLGIENLAAENIHRMGFISLQDAIEQQRSGAGKHNIDPTLSYVGYLILTDGTIRFFGFSLAPKQGSPLFQIHWDRPIGKVGLLGHEEIVARLKIDRNNDVYWAKNPELEETDVKALLVRLKTGQETTLRSIRVYGIQDNEALYKATKLEGSWRVFNGSTEERVRLERLRNAPEYQIDMFPDLRNLLNDLANPQVPARHIVYIVPDELEKWAEEYPDALRARESDRPEFWSQNNYRLHFSRIKNSGDGILQNDVLGNFDSMRESAGQSRPFLFGTLKEVRQISRPKLPVSTDGEFTPFHLMVTNRSATATQSVEGVPDVHPPHLLYLIATEGRRIPITEFATKNHSTVIPTVLVGTRKQWVELMSDAKFEESFGLAQAFEVRELEPPTFERRVALAQSLLKLADIRSLSYTVDPEGLLRPGEKKSDISQPEAERRFIEYLTHRAEILSRSNGIGIFEGFSRVANTLCQELTMNTKTRRDRILSKATAERVFSKIFSMPLNLEQLDKNDFLRILSRRDAGFLVQQAGYFAPLEFINRGIRAILSQLQQNDVKKMNSIMIIGESGSGKTQYLKTMLFDVLKLKAYDFRGDQETNRDASVFWVEMKKVREQGRNITTHDEVRVEIEDTHSMAEIDSHLDRFLISENGHRGFVVFDDIREAPPKVRSHFLARIRALQDNGTVVVRNAGKRVTISTRNLTPIVTLNPTDVAEEIERFVGKGKTPTQEDIILASLSSPDGTDNLNRSFLARWGAIINLDVAPSQAKGPKLLKTVKKSAETVFTTSQKLILVSSDSVREVTEAFPTYDFRTLVAPASSQMIQLPNREGSGVYIVVPRRSETKDTALSEISATGRFGSSSEKAGTDVEVYVQKRLKAIRVDADFTGRLEFMKFLLSNFRRRAFDWLVRSASIDARFSNGLQAQQFLLAPLAHAVHRHLKTHPDPQLNLLVLDEKSMGVKDQLQKHAFFEAWSRILQTEQVPLSPLPTLPSPESPQNIFEGELFFHSPREEGREKVMADWVHKLSKDLEVLLARSIGLKDLEKLPTSEAWMNALTTQDMNMADPMIRGLSESAFQFTREMMQTRSARPFFIPDAELDPYKVMRLFMVVLDRAMHRLTWGNAANFLVDGLQLAVSDLSKGQAAGVQHFLFESRSSPLSAVDLDLILGSAKYQPLFEETAATESKHHESFMQRCSALLREIAP